MKCPPGTVKQGDLCYEKPSDRFNLVGGVAWEKCSGDLPYECGGMCTRHGEECKNAIKKQAEAF